MEEAAGRLRITADALAQLDVLLALAHLAQARGYCRPELTDEPLLEIVDGRHPVLDVIEPEGTFVPNDTHASADAPRSADYGAQHGRQEYLYSTGCVDHPHGANG